MTATDHITVRKLMRRFRSGLSDSVERGVAVFVVLFIVGAILAPADSRHPISIFSIPVDGLAQALIERNRGLPAEFALDLLAIQSVPTIVARAILHVREQNLRLSDHAKQALCHRNVFLDVDAAKDVDLADAPALKDLQDAAAIVVDMKPIALLLPVPIEGKWLVVQGIGDHQRQELFWKLIGSVVVRRAGDQRGESIRSHV